MRRARGYHTRYLTVPCLADLTDRSDTLGCFSQENEIFDYINDCEIPPIMIDLLDRIGVSALGLHILNG
jgi:hypothetical protein